MNSWPEALDAAVAAPAHHRLLLENESVRVFETRINPGEKVPLHTHRWPATYYILSWGDFLRRDDQGEVTLDSRTLDPQPQAGGAMWAGPIGPHTLENVGNTPIHLISVESKNDQR